MECVPAGARPANGVHLRVCLHGLSNLLPTVRSFSRGLGGVAPGSTFYTVGGEQQAQFAHLRPLEAGDGAVPALMSHNSQKRITP